jgi:hypothetical protein
MAKIGFGDKVAHGGGLVIARQRAVPVLLRCGHVAYRIPELGNPDRWWCCGRWQRARRRLS